MTWKRQRKRRYGTAVWTRITEKVTETDTDERKRTAETRHQSAARRNNYNRKKYNSDGNALIGL